MRSSTHQEGPPGRAREDPAESEDQAIGKPEAWFANLALKDMELPATIAKPIDYVLRLAEASQAEMRAQIFELRPEAPETEGLVASFERRPCGVLGVP